MSGPDPVKLADWLRRATLSPKLPKVKQIVLNHWFASGDMKPAHVWDWSPEEAIPRVEELIEEVTSKSSDYANGIADGTVRYMLEAYHGDGINPWGTRFPFHVVARGPEAETAAYGQSEPATGAGLLGQLMRHLERKDEQMNRMIETVGKQQNKIIGDLQGRLGVFESRHLDTVRLYEDLLDRRHERELNAVYRYKKDAREAKGWDLLFSLGPVVASKFLSPAMAAALPGQITDGGPAMHIIRQLMKSLKEEQLPALMQDLEPDQVVMLMELHKIVAGETERKNSEEEDAKRVVPSSAEEMRRRRDDADREASRAQTVVVESEQVEAVK